MNSYLLQPWNIAGWFSHHGVRARLRRSVWLLSLILTISSSHAFPPAPHHLVFGSVRDEMGNPLMVTNAVVFLETLAGVRLECRVIPNLGPGLNYRLPVPMDAGLTSDPYKPTALRPTLPFRMKVTIAGVTYLPLEMAGNFLNLGQPAQTTRLDLTLGQDSDGDGLPDAWERTLLTGDMTLMDIDPHGDADGDGLTNLQEYLAGTYAFDSEDGLKLKIVYDENGHGLLEFLAITGRSYSVHGSSDLRTWNPVAFQLSEEGNEMPARTAYQAKDVRTMRLKVLAQEGQPPESLFLRAEVR